LTGCAPGDQHQRQHTECGVAFDAEVWLIVAADERPGLVARIRAGTLHTVVCPNGHAGPLIGSGAGMFLAPLWSVRDDRAKQFSEVFYTALLREFSTAITKHRGILKKGIASVLY
jgi:hypothetical protein